MSLGQGPAPEGMVDGWFDSHCHVQDTYLEGRPADPAAPLRAPRVEVEPSALVWETLARARSAGVGRIVCIGTDALTSVQALALARAVRAGGSPVPVPRTWATVGLHPHEASAGTEEVAGLVEAALSEGDGAIVAVGECGLDYFYEHSTRDQQRSAFAAQIALAHRSGLTLVVHARDAWDDLFDVLGAEGMPERAVLHCFTGGTDELDRCLDAGMFVSFSGIVTFKNAADVREAAARCPLDRLLVETDSPFLAPVPHRGRPNEPGYVSLVGAAVAALRGVDPADLARSTAAAACAAFGL